MKYTTNYNLPKAELTDAPPDISFVGDGFDKVDEALTGHDDLFVWQADRNNEFQEGINALAQQIAKKTWAPFCINSGALDSNGAPALLSYANDVSTSTELAFVQPVLTSNGTMGGSSFAVSANESNSTAYNVFGNTSNGWDNSQAPTESKPAEITIYNPNPLKITGINLQNSYNSANVWSKMTLLGSNTGNDWVTISTHNNSIRTANTWVSAGVTSNSYYKYYKFSFTSNTSNTYIQIQKISISGTYISTHTGGRVVFNGNIIATTAQGENFTASEINDLDVSKLTANKVYVYIGRNGTPTYTAGNLHTSPTTPTGATSGDVWFKTLEPLASYHYFSGAWHEINFVPVGEITMDGAGKITGVSTYPYNQNGYTVNTRTTATASTFGLVRTAAPEDETDCQCNDAALTPGNLYKLADFRLANTAYAVGDIVGVPYHAELLMQCTNAGTTGADALDTTAVKTGDIVVDGGVGWKVIKMVTGGYINKYPSWWYDRGLGDDGAFEPAENVTISGEKNYTSVNIPAGVTVTATGCKIKCQGTFVNNGTITVTPNGGQGGTWDTQTSGEVTSIHANDDAGFGYVSSGGAGGTSNKGSGKNGVSGKAGGAIEDVCYALSKLRSTGLLEFGIGGGGGHGGLISSVGNGANEHNGNGGRGGGVIAIVAETVVNAGTISAAGEDGKPGYTYKYESNCGGSGGGGGGGSVLIFADTINNTGSVSAHGGISPDAKSNSGTVYSGTYNGASGEEGYVFMKELK